MRRRQVLAAGTVLLSVSTAGCGHPPVVLDFERATDGDIADEVATTADRDSEEYAVVTEAAANGSATRRGRTELFSREDVVRVDDAFYRVSETRVASEDVTVYEVLVDLHPTDEPAQVGEIAFADLPETDRERLGRILDEEPPDGDDGGGDGNGYDAGVGYGTAAEVGDDSVFVPDRQYDVVVHDGDRHRVAVNSRTAAEGEYRYEATEVAASVGAFADRVRDRFLFALSGLSEAERAVVEEAIESAYFEDDDAFRSVVDRIRDREGIRVDDFYGTWLLTYETEEYLVYAEW